MPYLKSILLIQLFLYVIYTQAYPVSQDQHFSIFMSKLHKNPHFKINLKTPGMFRPDFGTHRYACDDRCRNDRYTMVSRPTKKDVFMSRSWSAGGMPFSVLYMKHPKNTRSPIAQQLKLPDSIEQLQEIPKPVRNYDEDYQLPEGVHAQAQALTTGYNGGGSIGSLPSRRQYSIIPQLFVSYGWGPLGK